jgi:hypothetical protein
MSSKKQAFDKEKYEALRERWDHEDGLLVSRTGIFLTANSILWAALGFQPNEKFFLIIIGIMGLLLSILWLTTSLHSFHVIRTLFQLAKDDLPYGTDQLFKLKPVLFRPNTVFGKLIPGLMIIGWLVEIVYAVLKPVTSV